MILIYTNNDRIKNKFPDVTFLDLDLIKPNIKKNIDNIDFSSVLIGSSADIWDRIIFAKFQDDNIVGLLCLSYNETGFKFNKDHQYACSFVSTDKNHQGKGFGSELINEMFKFASIVKIPRIKSSFYEVDYIEKTFKTNASKYPDVEFINPD